MTMLKETFCAFKVNDYHYYSFKNCYRFYRTDLIVYRNKVILDLI